MNIKLEYILPMDLKHLCLRDDLSNFCAYPWRAVGGLLDARATHIPRLGIVSFKICVDWSGERDTRGVEE